ncbi:peroxiredoxin [Guyparkeria sp.]|uniref:peroxiredoxin n=1 Tax=Guyparkeria sp. TaxID=2035736 RepID=UPI003565720B
MSKQTSSTPSPSPRPGDPAPDFHGQTGDGQSISLADCRGHSLVLYFYPRDNTPGCTTEARDFQARLADFEARGARVIGVSNDDETSHRRFCDKQGLTFPLIADTDRAISRAYDVLRMKNMFGKRFEGIERSTFLIDAEGMVRQAWRKVKVPRHVEEVLEALDSL